MFALGGIQSVREEYEQAVKWIIKGAEAGLPQCMFNLECSLDSGQGTAAPDYPAAADWYRRAVDAGNREAAIHACTRLAAVGHDR